MLGPPIRGATKGGGGAPLTKCKGPLKEVKKGPRKIKWPKSVEFLKMGVEMAPSK